MAVTEEAVLSFVRSSIRSAWALELLLLLRRDPQRVWMIDDLVRELRGSVALVTENLNSLSAVGLVAPTEGEGHAYRAETAEVDKLVTALVELYAQKPITVLQTIFTTPSDKIQSFSDAFLLKKR
jgi:hypothetical protein